MGFLSYGSAKGLALQHDYGRDIDRLYQREAYRAQVEAEKEQKARYYAGLMKEHPATAPSMTTELEGFYKDLNEQVADFAINNPGFETDVNKMQEFMGLTDQYLNNDMVRKDIQSQEQFARFKEALNKGEILEGSVEYEEQMDKYDDWLNNGGDGYVFTAKKLPTYGEIVENSNQAMNPDTSLRKEGNMYMNVSATPQSRVTNQAYVDFLDPNKKAVIERQFAEVSQMEGMVGVYDNAYDFHVKTLSAGEEVKKTYATWDPSVRANAAEQARKRAEMQQLYPYWSQNIAPNFIPGKSVKNHVGLEALTPWSQLNKPLNFGEQGVDIFIQDEKTGEMIPQKLKGEFSLTNLGDMRITPTTGGLIECHVRTTVNSVEQHTGKSYKVTKDGEEQYLTTAELDQWKIDEGLSEREWERMNVESPDGKAVKRSGSDYTVEKYEDASGLGDYYNSLGFTSTGIMKEGLLPDFSGGKSTFPTYSGKVYVNANITAATLGQYEKIKGGQKHADTMHQYRMADRQPFMAEQTSAGNYEFAAEYLNDSYESGVTHYYTEDGKPATKDSHATRVTNGKWQKDPQYPGLYSRVNKVTLADGTVTQVREGYDVVSDQFGEY